MQIAHNISAINTFNKMNISMRDQNKTMEKLSSGYKINRASDDAAGLSISEKMRSQIRGLNQASRNAENGITMIQTAEGALNETHSILQRMRELAVQAANDTNAESDRQALQAEINQLTSEINRIGNTTEFNGMNILDGSKVYKDFEDIKVANGGSINLGFNNGVQNQCNLILKSPINFNYNDVTFNTSTDVKFDKIFAAEKVNYIDFYKDGNELVFDMHIESNDRSKILDIKDNKLNVDEHGDYFYHDHGLIFTIDKDSVNEFIKSGSELSHTKVDLFKCSNFNGLAAGQVSGKTIKQYLTDWLNTDPTGEICFNADPGVYMYINKYGAYASDGSKTWTLDEIYAMIPDNQVFSESDSGNGKDFHYHAVLTGGTNKVFLSSSIQNCNIDFSNKYEDDSSINGYIDSFIVKDYKTGNEQNRIDYDKVEIDFQNASDPYVTFKQPLYRKYGSRYYPLTVINYKNYLNVDADGNVSLIGDVYKTLSGTALTAGELDNYVEGHVADKAYLNVTFYNGDEVVIKDQLGINGFGDITLGNEETLSYNANGISFNIELEQDFQNFDKVHAIIDLDKELNTSTETVSTNGIDNSVYFHVGANTNQVINSTFGDMRASALGLTGSDTRFTKELTVNNGTDSKAIERGLNISTREGANTAIEVIDNAIELVSKERSKYGSIQNRLEYTISNLNTTSENMTSAESTIRDVDMAQNMMELTKSQILSQASQAMLTQAIQRPEQVLQLLQ